MDLQSVSNSRLNDVIDDWIKSERNRYILKCRLIDGYTYVELATRFNLSERQVKSIVHDGLDILAAHL